MTWDLDWDMDWDLDWDLDRDLDLSLTKSIFYNAFLQLKIIMLSHLAIIVLDYPLLLVSNIMHPNFDDLESKSKRCFLRYVQFQKL